MAIKVKQFDGVNVTPTDDAIFNALVLGASGIVEGCAPTWLGTNQIKVAAGRGFALGRQFTVDETTITVTLSGGSKGRLLINIDVGNSTPGSFVSQAAATLPDLVQQDINHGGTVFQVPICTYDVGALAISNMVDARVMIVGAGVIDHDAAKVTSGVLPLARGGTGATTAALARTSLGIPYLGSIVYPGGSIDTVTDTGFYRINGSSLVPDGSIAGLLIHQQWDLNFAYQCIMTSGGKRYERFKIGGTWQTINEDNFDYTNGTYKTISANVLRLLGDGYGVVMGSQIRPVSGDSYYDGIVDLGSYGTRFKTAYVKNGVDTASDERLKKDIANIDKEKSAAFIDGINVVSFRYKNDEDDQKPRIGVIAQQLESVDSGFAPFFVDIEPDEEQHRGLRAADLVFPLIQAVQSLNDRVAALESEVAALKAGAKS